MGPCILLVLMFVILLLHWRSKGRKDIVVNMPLIAYLSTSFFCLIQYSKEPQNWSLSYWSYLYYIIVFIILLFPIWKSNPSTTNKIIIKNSRIVRYLAAIFVVFSVVSVYLTLNKAVDALATGEWLRIRNEMYYGDFEVYSTTWERISLNGRNFMSLFITVYFFYQLAYVKDRKNWFNIILLAIAVFIPPFLGALTMAARGTMFLTILRFVLIYLFFRKRLSNKISLIIRTFFFSLSIFVLIISIAITIARFDDSAKDSILYYFGHSLLSFNYGVADSIHSFSHGKWFLGDYYNLISDSSGDLDFGKLGTHFGTAFITLIGCLYVDFGPFGTIIFSLVISLIFAKSIGRKKHLTFQQSYLYLFYVDFLIGGVFVYGQGYGFKIIFSLILFWVTNINYGRLFPTKRVVKIAEDY